MNRWLQSRVYECPKCKSHYLHDMAYKHNLSECPKRPAIGRKAKK